MAQSRYTDAEPYFRDALEIRRRMLGDQHPETLASIGNIGRLLLSQGRYTVAEPYFREAEGGYRQLLGDDHSYTIKILYGLAELLYARGDYTTAESIWGKAEDSFEQARLRISVSGFGRINYVAHRSHLAPLAACLARNGKLMPAWQRLEAKLARGLLDTLSARYARPLDDNDRRRETDLIGQLNKIDERISALMEQKEETNEQRIQLEKLGKDRERFLAEFSQFEAAITTKYGVAAGEVYDLPQIQSQLADDTALLAWVDIKGDPHAADPNGEHWACVVRNQGDPIWLKLPGSGKKNSWTADDNELPNRLRKELGHDSVSISAIRRRALIQRLHEQRLAPIKPHLTGVNHLIVLPAGLMAGIPVEVLTNDYTVSYAPSGTMYAWLKEKGMESRKPIMNIQPDSLLALGDPVFSQPRKRKPLPKPPDHGVMVASLSPESNADINGLKSGDVLLSFGGVRLSGPETFGPVLENVKKEMLTIEKIPVAVWRSGEVKKLSIDPGELGVEVDQRPAAEAILWDRRLDEVMTATRGGVYSPLPASRDEVTFIAGLFDLQVQDTENDSKPTLLLGSEASEQRLDELAANGKLKQYKYIHLATHGVMDDRIAMNSALILSQDNLPDAFEQALAGEKVYDGRLTAEQIVRTWKLDADLVTLSGCETALGKESGGEGFLGFSQALFVSGARSLLLSLWKVDDRATMLLMKRFYENMLGRYGDDRTVAGQTYSAGVPIPKARALREAKAWLRNLTYDEFYVELKTADAGTLRSAGNGPTSFQGDYADRPFHDPHFWAPFILIGNPE